MVFTKHHDFLMRTDGVCVYVTVGIKVGWIGKIYLLIMHAAALAVIGIALKEWIPVLLLIFLLLEGWLLKYTLWNLFGMERMIINTKSISFQYDYGFFRTSYVIRDVNKILDVRFSEAINKRTHVHFTTYDEKDIPIEIYSTVIPITLQKGERLTMLVKQLLVDTFTNQYEWPQIHMN